MNVNPFSYLIEKLKSKANVDATLIPKINVSQKNVSHTLTFTGTCSGRTLLGEIQITGQNASSNPIAFSCAGIGTVNISTSIITVAPNDLGITGGTGTITVPANVNGGWGTIEIFQYFGRLDSVTITDS